jgi:DNA-binding SARP family transcriptional activator
MLGKLRQAGAAPLWARGLGALLAALVLLAAPAPPAHAAEDSAMEPNSVQNDVEAYDGAEFNAPADGRIRGFDFAFTVTKAGPVRRVKRMFGWDAAGDGQRLVGFKLQVDRTPEGVDHEVHGAVLADGGRIAIYKGDLNVQPREYGFVASVPAGAKEVALELSSGGYSQRFSLTQLRRVGPEPAVLYRDPLSPDVSRDGAGERTIRVTEVTTGDKGALTFTLNRARLSFFTPPEPVGPADDPSKAFVVIEADVDSPDTGEAQFAHYKALPASAVTATLTDGTVVPAQHTGPDDKAYMSGYYYFAVPGDIEAARVTISPGTFDAYHYGESGAEPTPVKADGAAVFDIEFTPGGAAKLPKLAKGAAATATTAADADGPRGNAGSPPRRTRGGGSPLPMLLLVLIAAAAGAGVVLARLRRGDAPQPPPTPSANGSAPVSEAALDPSIAAGAADGVTWLAAAGMVAEAAARGCEVVVLATGDAAGIGEAESTARVLRDAGGLRHEVEAACLSAARRAAEAEHDGRDAPQEVLVVVPAPEAGFASAAGDAAAGELVVVRVLAVTGGRPASAAAADGGNGNGVGHPLSIDGPASTVIAQTVTATGVTVEPSSNGRAEGVSVELLGRHRITVDGTEVTTGVQTKAVELLTLLALHPEGVTAEAVLDSLWPSLAPKKARSHLHKAVTNLRAVLRPAAPNGDGGSVVERTGAWYRLDASLSIDVRHLDAAATAAASGDDAAAERAAGQDYPWVEPERERLRRTVLDTLSRLAERRRAAGDLEGAAAALDRAISIDRHSEPLYRELMAVQRQQRREDAVRRTYARLERALAEIDATPEPQTTALLDTGATPLP